MNTKVDSKFLSKSGKEVASQLVTNRRGVSEIIVTLLLLVVTLISAVMVFSLFQTGSPVADVGSMVGAIVKETEPTIKLIGHDTRDGSNLANISGLNNNNDDVLDSNDFIVLHIRNIGTKEFAIDNVHINDIGHSRNSANAGQDISSPANQPAAGEFKIISSTTTTILSSATVERGAEARIVLKLSSSVGTINLAKEMRILINPSSGPHSFHVVPAGSVN